VIKNASNRFRGRPEKNRCGKKNTGRWSLRGGAKREYGREEKDHFYQEQEQYMVGNEQGSILKKRPRGDQKKVGLRLGRRNKGCSKVKSPTVRVRWTMGIPGEQYLLKKISSYRLLNQTIKGEEKRKVLEEGGAANNKRITAIKRRRDKKNNGGKERDLRQLVGTDGAGIASARTP